LARRDAAQREHTNAVRYSALVAMQGARIINLRKISDPKGNLTPIEGSHDVPFEIRRVYYTYDIPGGETRGGHAHRRIQEFVIAASGSFEVALFDGKERQSYFLNRSYYGLFIPELVWRELTNFSSGSVCLVLASDHYDEAEYIRDSGEFLKAVRLRASS
jgi:dTDP-4-dehydrorhamnose 3,5-epimerase-like enzyme